MFSTSVCRNMSNSLYSFARSPCLCMRFSSAEPVDPHPKVKSSSQQVSCYTAQDIEFCPNRNREVLQNYVVEVSEGDRNEDPFAAGKDFTPAAPMSDRDHLEAYKAGNAVSLYSVMQSNVPEPFSTRGKSPTHLNMPGGSCSQGYKYLSGKMQNTHQSKK